MSVVGPVAALQATLAGEHAAVYVFGVLGGQVSDRTQPALAAAISASYLAHRRRRDRLVDLIGRRGATPVASAATYALPNALSGPADLRRAGAQVETRCVALYARLVASASGADRAWAITALTQGAVSELAYGVAPSDLPGVAAG